MKFLCLHGSYGSAANFQTQLAPFVDEAAKSGLASFRWIDGFHAVEPPARFGDYFGKRPLYAFTERDGVAAMNEFAERMQQFAVESTPEKTIRKFFQGQEVYPKEAFQDTMQRLRDVLAADPEIEGILGYSEGAAAAASLILEERSRCKEQGVPRRLKCAIFFGGWPPLVIKEGKVQCMLTDDVDDDLVIDVATCHVVGCKDPYLHGSMTLFDVCDPDTAELFDHGSGHTLPRDPEVLKELVAVIEKMLPESAVGR
ncbi:hypothetical protein CDD83_6824 [Cordyceps sp. RAO-2017]|nr:hypothetical protein CDD83_6824 [Cordyceps sp. RAO-2017]